MSDDSLIHPASETFEVSARLTLFGFEATEATVRIRPRSRSWRLWGAARTQAAGLVLAPMVGLVPPHAPWALGALGVSFLLARRRWHHLFTLEDVTGRCPKCGAAVAPRSGRLLESHPVPCDGCHHELALVLPAGALDGITTDQATPAPHEARPGAGAAERLGSPPAPRPPSGR